MLKPTPTIIKRSLAVSAAAILGCLSLSGIASASSLPNAVYAYEAQLNQLNNSGTYGYARVVASGNKATIYIRTTGASAGLPHAEHIHLGPGDGKAGMCPTIAADANGDGLISVAEAAPNYGPIGISLTTSGDTSAASALAVDRFPVAAADGSFTYERTVDLPQGVTASQLGNTEIVQHGISKLFNNPAKYDGSKVSSIDPSLPLEATIPADCGGLHMTGQFNPVTAKLTNNVHTLQNQLLSDADMASTSVPMANSAIANYKNAVNSATNQYIVATTAAETASKSNHDYTDTLNNAKTMYLNQLDVARNSLVAQLSGMGHDANIAKDMLVNSFNQYRDYFTNQAEVIKND